jgi:hypothetical protein
MRDEVERQEFRILIEPDPDGNAVFFNLFESLKAHGCGINWIAPDCTLHPSSFIPHPF